MIAGTLFTFVIRTWHFHREQKKIERNYEERVLTASTNSTRTTDMSEKSEKEEEYDLDEKD